MEIASKRTGKNDVEDKPARYAALGISEYWRFDETGAFHLTRLAGDILVGDSYQPIPVDEAEPDILQGYSPALGLLIRWDHGQLLWWDPETQAPIPTFETEREYRLLAENRADSAEARVRELQEELERRNRRR